MINRRMLNFNQYQIFGYSIRIENYEFFDIWRFQKLNSCMDNFTVIFYSINLPSMYKTPTWKKGAISCFWFSLSKVWV